MGLFSKKPGETDDQSKTEVDKLLDAFSAKLDEKLEAANKPLREGFTALKTEWDALKAEANKKPEPSEDELTPEQKAERDRNNLLAVNIQTRAMFTEQRVLDALPAEWSHLKPELQEMFQNTHLNTKALPTYPKLCQDALDMLVGREMRKGGVRRSTNGTFFIEDSKGGGGGDANELSDFGVWQDGQGGRVESATDTLRKLGIDPKKFAEDHKNGLV